MAVSPPNLPLTWSPVRAMFSQPGLPRQIAEREGLYYADRINDQSPMWMGFSDNQISATGPAERLLTSTRRQNFLCPLRRHRAFPFVELT